MTCLINKLLITLIKLIELAVDIITKVAVAHDEDADVGDAADISELRQLVLHRGSVDTNLNINKLVIIN